MRKIFVTLLPLFLLVACSKEGENKKDETKKRIPTVEAVILKPSSIEKKLRLLGTVTGGNEVLVFPDMGGRLLELKVRNGQYVSKGQLVALIDRSAPGFDVKPLTVTAPASGYVQTLIKDIGAPVGKNKALLKIVDKRSLKVVVNVPEPFASKVKRGTKMYVEGYPTLVSSVDPALDPRTRTLRVEGILRKGEFVPGQSVLVDLVVERKDSTFVLPSSAIVAGEGVFVVKGGKAKYVPVKLGIRTSEKVEIREGLKYGDTVVVLGASFLEDGQKVKMAVKQLK